MVHFAIPLLMLLGQAGAAEAARAQSTALRVQALARAEIIAPVTNDPAAGRDAPIRVISQTRDGRDFVEYQ